MNLVQLLQTVATALAVACLLLLARWCFRRSSSPRAVKIAETRNVGHPVSERLDPPPLKPLKKMRKAELVAECDKRNVQSDGKVDMLRAILVVERKRDALHQKITKTDRYRSHARERGVAAISGIASSTCSG